jgi:hypothetical protein
MGDIHEIKCGLWQVTVFDPNTGKLIDQAIAASEGEAYRFAHFCNRTYIIGKMTGWLNQRRAALHHPGFEGHRAACHQLMVMLGQMSQTSVDVIRAKLTQNRQLIELIAPREQSPQYPYYDTVIKSIMAFCQETEEPAHA